MTNRCPSCKHFAEEVDCRCLNCGTQWRFSFLSLTRAYEQALVLMRGLVRSGEASLAALAKDVKDLGQ